MLDEAALLARLGPKLDRTARAVYRRAATVLVHEPWLDVEDLEQEARIAALDAARRFDPSSSMPFDRWVVWKVKRLLLEMLRRQVTGRHGELMHRAVAVTFDLPDSEPGPEERVLWALELDRCLAAIAALTDRERRALLAGATRTGAALGRKLGVSKSRISQIRAGAARAVGTPT
jgi:RNA polymerase sigma factor (sigma-70 family)